MMMADSAALLAEDRRVVRMHNDRTNQAMPNPSPPNSDEADDMINVGDVYNYNQPPTNSGALLKTLLGAGLIAGGGAAGAALTMALQGDKPAIEQRIETSEKADPAPNWQLRIVE
jgi:hypothetical protein